jgi:DNA-binding response OmpR family regulator
MLSKVASIERSSRTTMSSTRKPPTILVVDDEPDIVGMVLAILELGAFEAVGASNADEALVLATSRIPDAIILDRNLEDSQCGELVARLAADPSTAHIPILLMTADPDGEQAALALGAGVTGAIRKPFDPDALLHRLRTVFARAVSATGRRATGSGVRARVATGADSHTAAGPGVVDLLIVTGDAPMSAALDAVARERALTTRHAASFREAVESARRFRPRNIAIELSVSKAKTMELVRALRDQQHMADNDPRALTTHVRPVLLLGPANDLDARLAIAALEATVFLAATCNHDQLDRAVGRLLAFSGAPGNVLVVGPASDLVEDTLRGHGFTVTHADDALDAIAVVASGVDVVLVDERVPAVSPIELCGALARSADARLRSVVLLSRRLDEETRRAALRVGADEVLGPRESAEGIVACVRRRIERNRAAFDASPRSRLEHAAHAHAGTPQRRVR